MSHVSTSSVNRSCVKILNQFESEPLIKHDLTLATDLTNRTTSHLPQHLLKSPPSVSPSLARWNVRKTEKSDNAQQRTAMHDAFSQSQALYPLSLLSPPAHLGGLSGLSPSLGQTEQPNVVQRSKGLVRIYKPSNALQTDIRFLRLNERGMYIDESHGIEEMLVKPFRQQPPYQHWVSERSRWDVAGTFCWCLRTSFLRVHSVNRYFQCIQSKSDQCFLNSENIEYNRTTLQHLTTLYPRAPPLRWVWALLAAVPAWSSNRFYTAIVYNSTLIPGFISATLSHTTRNKG